MNKFSSKSFFRNLTNMGSLFWYPFLFITVDLPIFFKDNISKKPILSLATPLYILGFILSVLALTLLAVAYVIYSIISEVLVRLKLWKDPPNIFFYFRKAAETFAHLFIYRDTAHTSDPKNDHLHFPAPRLKAIQNLLKAIDVRKLINFIKKALDATGGESQGEKPSYRIIDKIINGELTPEDIGDISDLILRIRAYYHSQNLMPLNGSDREELNKIYQDFKDVIKFLMTQQYPANESLELKEKFNQGIDNFFTEFNNENTFGIGILSCVNKDLLEYCVEHKEQSAPLLAFIVQQVYGYDTRNSEEEIKFIKELILHVLQKFPPQHTIDMLHHLGEGQVIEFISDVTYQSHIATLMLNLEAAKIDDSQESGVNDSPKERAGELIQDTIDNLHDSLLKTELMTLKNQEDLSFETALERLKTLSPASLINEELIDFLMDHQQAAALFVARNLTLSLDGNRCYFKKSKTVPHANPQNSTEAQTSFHESDPEREKTLSNLISAALTNKEQLKEFLLSLANINHTQESIDFARGITLKQSIEQGGLSAAINFSEHLSDQSGFSLFLSKLNMLLKGREIKNSLKDREKNEVIGMFVAELIVPILALDIKETNNEQAFPSIDTLGEAITLLLNIGDNDNPGSLITDILDLIENSTDSLNTPNFIDNFIKKLAVLQSHVASELTFSELAKLKSSLIRSLKPKIEEALPLINKIVSEKLIGQISEAESGFINQFSIKSDTVISLIFKILETEELSSFLQDRATRDALQYILGQNSDVNGPQHSEEPAFVIPEQYNQEDEPEIIIDDKISALLSLVSKNHEFINKILPNIIDLLKECIPLAKVKLVREVKLAEQDKLVRQVIQIVVREHDLSIKGSRSLDLRIQDALSLLDAPGLSQYLTPIIQTAVRDRDLLEALSVLDAPEFSQYLTPIIQTAVRNRDILIAPLTQEALSVLDAPEFSQDLTHIIQTVVGDHYLLIDPQTQEALKCILEQKHANGELISLDEKIIAGLKVVGSQHLLMRTLLANFIKVLNGLNPLVKEVVKKITDYNSIDALKQSELIHSLGAIVQVVFNDDSGRLTNQETKDALKCILEGKNADGEVITTDRKIMAGLSIVKVNDELIQKLLPPVQQFLNLLQPLIQELLRKNGYTQEVVQSLDQLAIIQNATTLLSGILRQLIHIPEEDLEIFVTSLSANTPENPTIIQIILNGLALLNRNEGALLNVMLPETPEETPPALALFTLSDSIIADLIHKFCLDVNGTKTPSWEMYNSLYEKFKELPNPDKIALLKPIIELGKIFDCLSIEDKKELDQAYKDYPDSIERFFKQLAKILELSAHSYPEKDTIALILKRALEFYIDTLYSAETEKADDLKARTSSLIDMIMQTLEIEDLIQILREPKIAQLAIEILKHELPKTRSWSNGPLRAYVGYFFKIRNLVAELRNKNLEKLFTGQNIVNDILTILGVNYFPARDSKMTDYKLTIPARVGDWMIYATTAPYGHWCSSLLEKSSQSIWSACGYPSARVCSKTREETPQGLQSSAADSYPVEAFHSETRQISIDSNPIEDLNITEGDVLLQRTRASSLSYSIKKSDQQLDRKRTLSL